MHPLKNIFNKIFWDERLDKKDYLVTFIHRGAPSNEKTIPTSLIKQIGKSWFTYQDQDMEEVYIPMHRVVSIRNLITGEVLWRKRMIPRPS